MCQQVYIFTVLCVVFAAFIQSGYGLQCWKCSSQKENHCLDHFNTTEIQQSRLYNNNYRNTDFPELVHCEDKHTVSQIADHKNVCLKKVIKGASNIKTVNRECRMVSRNLKEGSCPDDIKNSVNSENLYFCGTCEHDGCNAGNGLKTNFVLTGLVPAVFLLLRK